MTYAQPQADPTNVVGRRIGAYAIDLIIMAIILLAMLVPLFLSASTEAPSGAIDCGSSSFDSDGDFGSQSTTTFCFDDGDTVRYLDDDAANAFTAQVYGASFGLSALNLVILQGLTGASLGKLILGLRVIREDGKKAGIGWAALRWVLLFVDGFCCFLPGAILVFSTKGHRRLGDMAASSFVVRTSNVGQAPQVPGVTAANPYGAPPSSAAAGAWGAHPQAPAQAPNADGPTWDPARNAYIQYDQAQSAWVQWNDAAQSWGPIDQ